MGNKKGAPRQVHPQKSFEQYVADATLNKFQGYIDQNMQAMAQTIVQHVRQQNSTLFTRLIVLEELLLEKFPDVTKDQLVARVATLEDKYEGYTTVADGAVEAGDRLRIEVSSKQSDAAEFSPPSRLLVNNVGSGETLGKELENSVLGLLTGETREVVYGKDGQFTTKITVNRISRKPKLTVEEAAPIQSEETPDASVNAG